MQSAELRIPEHQCDDGLEDDDDIIKAEAQILAVYGTPKEGIGCGRCGDWGTVVIRVRGGTREVICPVDGCQAAEQVRQRRARDDHDQ